MRNFERVSQGVYGRLAMSEPDADILQEYARQCGTWCEIGTLWGGSAILAALANPALKVTTIDTYEGLERESPKLEEVKRNLIAFDVVDHVECFQISSQEYQWRDFDGVFVDGSHEGEALRFDIETAKKHAVKFILFHDTDDSVVSTALEKNMDGWKIIAESERIQVYQRP